MSHFSTPIGSECAEFWLMNYPNYIIEILIRSCRQLVREIIIGNVSCRMQHTVCCIRYADLRYGSILLLPI